VDERFACDNCGRQFPKQQSKEVFREEEGREVREELCPECLDRRMNSAADVYGVEGETKSAAAYVSDQPDQPPTEDVSGRRGEAGRGP
jgi:uncharacterized protein CbrC (UPF0167 family)